LWRFCGELRNFLSEVTLSSHPTMGGAMRAFPILLAFLGSVVVAEAQDAPAPVILPAVVEPGPAAAGNSAAQSLAAPASAVKVPNSLAQQPISGEDARRMMMLLMMRHAASGFPAVLLRPAE
jgi:hypothetical protein